MPSSSSISRRVGKARWEFSESSSEGWSSSSHVDFSGQFVAQALSRNWVNNPSFWQLKKDGQPLPPMGFNTQKVDSASSLFLLESVTPTYRENAWEGRVAMRERVSGDIAAFGQLTHPSIDESNFRYHHIITDDEVFVKLRDGLNGGEAWNSLIFGAEGRSSAKMIVSGAERLLSAVRFAKRGNIRGLKGIFGSPPPNWKTPRVRRSANADAASSLWLEYTYGWKPLVQDIGNAVVSLDALISRRSNPQGNRRLRSTLRRAEESDELVYMSGSPYTLMANRHQYKQEFRRATLNWRVSSHDLYNAKSFGFTNPAEVAYELMFLSFVVDWVVPIGDYLSSLDNHLGVEIVGDWSISSKIVLNWAYSGLHDPAGRMTGGFRGMGPETNTTFVVREPRSGSVPLPSLDFLRPRPQLGASRLTSAIALTKTILFGAKR